MPSPSPNVIRRRLDLRGQVQGVGFRPFVYRLAQEHALAGHVGNNSNGAFIEVEGPPERVAAFERDLADKLPPLARITELHKAELTPAGESGFRISVSQADAARRPEVTPDAATCRDCLRELLDPADRRYRYPFINCTNCGPRYSIIRTVPYDRPGTTMAPFQMCPRCAAEYADPANRRFHAQPNACADCGPRLQLVHAAMQQGTMAITPFDGDPAQIASQRLARGEILAVKGIGGFHLACRADRENVVQRLRERKLRDGKPLAVMVPSEAAARRVCRLTETDLRALASPAAPIVLARKNEAHGLAESIAPGCNTFGIMLPYAPVHHLLFAAGLGPLVMTSANLAGQPLTYRDEDAFAELHEVADAFLIHDREIFRPIDDSVVFTYGPDVIPIRRARGSAPRPLRLRAFADGQPLAGVGDRRILAVGGELKSTVCLLYRGEAIISEHLGDLSHPQAYRHFVDAIARLQELFDFRPDVVVHDLHPQYQSTVYAGGLGVPTMAVQHHHAHIASVMAECEDAGPLIGLSCDGTGYGTDGAIWGGEVLYCRAGEFKRVGHLEYFPLVGGDIAAIETWRPAAALLRQAFGTKWRDHIPISDFAPSAAQLDVFEQQAAANVNVWPTSSLGRIFDAVSFLLGLCSRNRHEAEAAIALEAAAGEQTAPSYSYEIAAGDDGLRLSLIPTIKELVAARNAGEPAERSAARFHETIARLLTDAADRACREQDVAFVALSGGCFANRRLLARLVELLETRELQVLYHRGMPSGDGGLALGQALAAAWRLAGQSAASRHVAGV